MLREDNPIVIRGFHVASRYETDAQLAGTCRPVAEEEDLAREMIRALDAESSKHMENISAAEKASGEKAA